MLMNKCHFGENQQKENHIFLNIVKETTLTAVPKVNVKKKTG